MEATQDTPRHLVLKDTTTHKDIQGGIKPEHLVDTSPSTLHRLFSSLLRVLVENSIALTKAHSNTIDPASMKRVRSEYVRDTEIVGPYTKTLLKEDGQLPFEDPTFMLAVCNLLINMTTVVEHAIDVAKRHALDEMVRQIMKAADAVADTGPEGQEGRAMVLSGSPEEVLSALQQMGQQSAVDANPTTDEVGKPPVH